MRYKIEKGDKFLCLEEYVMEDYSVAYTKGKEYVSEMDGKITDNEFDTSFLLYTLRGKGILALRILKIVLYNLADSEC